MDDDKRQLIGSPSRDQFKRAHKELASGLYACDLDFVLVSKYPPGIVAFLDYKRDEYDFVQFTEAIAYNDLMDIAPGYIVMGRDPDNGPFSIYRYLLPGQWRPNPPIVHLSTRLLCPTWEDYEEWEWSLRREYTKRGGWKEMPVFDWERPQEDFYQAIF